MTRARPSPAMAGHLRTLEDRIGYRFARPELFDRAMTHSSQTRGGKDYQRLEFLGDRVLGLVVAEQLIERFPGEREGDLSRRLNYLVRRETCTEVARQLDLGAAIAEGLHKRAEDVLASANVLGDACEALIAAIYLDGGLEAARAFIVKHWEPLFVADKAILRDAKTRLQEWALARGLAMPEYTEIAREGPDHAPRFVIGVSVGDRPAISGEAASKRGAEQAAAANFMKKHRIKPA